MAAVVHGVDFNDTLNTSVARVTGSFTPAANDLLVCFVCQDGTSTVPTSVTDSQGGTWTLVVQGQKSSLDVTALYVRDSAVAASSMTVTVTPGAAGTGICIAVERVSGLTRYGSSAVKQSAKVDNTGSGTRPFVTFGANVLTGNPTAVCVLHGDAAASITPPTSWTERCDISHATPTRSMETASRDSGFTGVTVTWGANVATAWGSLGVELDTSAAGTVFNQSVDGGITPAGALIKTDTKVLTAGNTPAGALIKTTTRALTGGNTPAGAVVKQASKAFTGGITPAGALASTKVAVQLLTAGITPAGVLVGKAFKTLAGANTPAGALAKQLSRALTGGNTPAGAVVKTTVKPLVATVTPAGALVKKAIKLLTGAFTPAGTLAGTKVAVKTVSGGITPDGGTVGTTFIPAGPAGEPGRLTVYDDPATHTKLT